MGGDGEKVCFEERLLRRLAGRSRVESFSRGWRRGYVVNCKVITLGKHVCNKLFKGR